MCSYMKKIWIGLIFLLAISLVVALDEPSVVTGEEDVEKIEGIIEDYSPLDDSGSVDIGKYRPIVTKAEMRIDKINLWLEENATWLKVVFGMVPSITWLFAINLFLLLFSFIMLFRFFGLMISEKKIDLMFFEITWGNILGIIAFATLLFTKMFAKLAILSGRLVATRVDGSSPWAVIGKNSVDMAIDVPMN